MSDLDDALNDSSLVFAPPDLEVDWRDGPLNQTFSTDPESIANFGPRMSGTFEVMHSLDDGLPDPVTMTNQNEASGVLTADLVGRNPMVADVWGWRAGAGTSSATGASLIIAFFPAGTAEGDLVIAAITVNSLTAVVKAERSNDWTLVSTVSDSPWKTWIFVGRAWVGGSSGRFITDVAVNYTCTAVAGWATTADGTLVGMEVGPVMGVAESVSGTTHTTPVVQLERRGWIVGVWATGTAAGPWTAGAGTIELGEAISTGNTMVSISGQLDQGRYTISANTTLATAIATIQGLPVYVADRPAMDAKSYYSPFNRKSPIYGLDRDIAGTELGVNVLTASGVQGTTLHRGQMADIGIKGRVAELSAVSETRIGLDKALTLPTVSGPRENCSVDWLATWIMARGGQFVGPGPGPLTRYWAPFYGSTHAHMDTPYGYNYAIFFDSSLTPTGPYGLKPPSVVPGPFLTGMFACQTATRREAIAFNAIRMDLSREVFPNVAEQFPDGLNYDQVSLASSAGRLTFWLRGDPAVSAPSYTILNDYLMSYNLLLQDTGDNYLALIQIRVRSDNRHLQVTMGSTSGGLSTLVFTSSLTPLETDGEWHFYGIAWDYAAGTVKIKRDAAEGSSNAWATNGYNVITGLSTTDAAAIAKGHTIRNQAEFHLPVSDLQIESGAGAYGNPWTRHYPVPAEMNAVMRPTYQRLEAIAEPSPVQGWETLAKLAQATLSHYRTNEGDNFEFLPLTYFGEPEQLDPTVVADTEVNAGELDVIQDPSRTRNVVTVNYQDTKVDTNLSNVLGLRSAVEIPKGSTLMTFPLDIPAAEIHGQSDPFGQSWDISHLSSAALANPSIITNAYHYMTVNSNPEGTGYGAGYTNVLVTARLISATANTVTIQFFNKNIGTGKLYLANNVDGVPFLRIAGYAVRINEGYVTERDGGSINTRRERALDAEINWIQTRETATTIAQWMVTALARPRAQVTVEVMGDPRRTPGMMVELKDAEGTQAEGTWRILSVKSNGDGPRFTQTLSLVAIPPPVVWDGLPGWDEGIWGE